MAKIFSMRLQTFFILTIMSISSSTRIQCKYEVKSFYFFGDKYRCNIINDPKMNSHESAIITSAHGDHEDTKTNSDVLGLFSESESIEYFPKNAEKIFNNLEAISLNFCPLKEIFQSDLKSLSKLTYLLIGRSDIEVIEEGLFNYNPNLEYLIFDGSKLIHIDPNVFDNLSRLKLLYFYAVPCSGQLRSEYDYEIKIAIQRFRAECVNLEYLELNDQLEELKNQSLRLNVEDFNEKLGKFEVSFNNSKFSKFRPLKNKFENLKNIATVKEHPKLSLVILLAFYKLF
ncbi:unnamed protein product [Chironomus riparius]|uniref:Uncharacterized protein n=2 Tax=Chironomus riparius TaxID=315576 RepID=A0A9N9S7G7_9DIPT|nr:unnamed protein product [Chironomus riparius]